jgi:hypothetical protein
LQIRKTACLAISTPSSGYEIAGPATSIAVVATLDKDRTIDLLVALKRTVDFLRNKTNR